MISINYIATFLLVVFSGYFINTVSVSPIYIFFILGVFGITIYCIKKRRIPYTDVQVFALIFVMYIFVSQTLFMQNKNHAKINVLFSLIYLIITILGLSSLNRDDVIEIGKYFIWISIPLLVIEAVYRISHPIVYNNNEIEAGRAYYKYKYNSIMFEDSNYVGVFIICLFFLCVYLEHNYNQRLKIPKYILLLLAIATFSKAAIATMIIFFVVFDLEISRLLKGVIIITAAAFGLSDFISQILKDGSLYGKLNIIYSTTKYLSTAPIYRVLFGVGFGNTKNVITLGAHNMIATYVVESGVIGLLMLLILWGMLLRGSHGKMIIVMAPIFMDAMSLIGHAIPFVYCAFAIIYVLETGFYKDYYIENSIN